MAWLYKRKFTQLFTGKCLRKLRKIHSAYFWNYSMTQDVTDLRKGMSSEASEKNTSQFPD